MAVENDLVLVYMEDQPITYARIESITPDHKPDWYHVELLMLQVPLQTVTWILRTAYINGDEFTMGGNRMRLEFVKAQPKAPETGTKDTTSRDPAEKSQGKIISFPGSEKK